MSSACLRYLHESFRDHHPARAGALCGIDIDWVLEARWLFFPAPSPAGMLAIRALTSHGHRPVIATGRSLGEVRERCAHYGVAGGVAEYGAAVYDHLSGQARDLLEADERVLMEELRNVLRDLPGVFVDPAYRHSIRAYEVSGEGTRGLDSETTARALERCRAAERVRAMSARSQTDFVPMRVDKGTGLVALAAELGELGEDRDEGHLLALAVGDSSGDLPMLDLAARRFAPANAEAELWSQAESRVSGIEIVDQPVARGLLEAVARFLGHDPSGCPVCQPTRPPSRDALLLHAVLEATGESRRERFRNAAQLVVHSRR
jgi:hydroxymethylpyrimidine pyrophosphatase-like HAD family hydrolase